MNVEDLSGSLRYTMLALGVLFLCVDIRVGADLVQWFKRRRLALVTWAPPRPPYYAVNLAIGVMLGMLLLVNVVLLFRKPPLPHPEISIFGVLMMFLYYGYLLPLSTRIARGLYQDGIWTDSRFMRYADIGGLSWKDGQWPTLVLASRLKTLGRRLTVPGSLVGEVRHLLRDKIAEHSIEFDGGPGIHLGSRDTRESV